MSQSDSGSSLGSFGADLERELAGGAPLQELADDAGAPEGELRETKRLRVAPPDDGLLPAAAEEAAVGALSAEQLQLAADAFPPAAPADPAAVCPPHPGFLRGMCIRCCALKPDGLSEEGAVQLAYISKGLEVSGEEAARLRGDETRRTRLSRKLLLVLDLDHTLLNSARAQDVLPGSSVEAAILSALAAQPPDALPELYDLRRVRLWTKLRPGARALLAAAGRLCELTVYTMGDSGYAAEMAALLDPGGSLLRRGRLIAASDSSTSGIKDLDVVLGDVASAIILDDTPAVWRRHAANVVAADRYHYFPSSARGHGRSEDISWLSRLGDEDAADGIMAALSRLITRTHAAFFDGIGAGGPEAAAVPLEARDVRDVLRAQRSAVLRGLCLVFTAVIPTGDPPERHLLWRLAVDLGALCSAAATDAATHVVAGAAGTDKARWGAAKGLPCVSPEWLKACSARWERVPEAAFLVA